MSDSENNEEYAQVSESESDEDENFARIEKKRKPPPDGRKAARTPAQIESLKKAQAALKVKREQKLAEQEASKPKVKTETPEKPVAPRPKETVKSKKKRQTKIILEHSSSDESDEPELVIRRSRRKGKARVKAEKPRSRKSKGGNTDDSSDELIDEPTVPNIVPPPQQTFTPQQILRAFNL